MSLLRLATVPAKATKGIEQEEQARHPGVVYLPLENRQTWTADWVAQPEARALSIATFYAGVRVLSETFAMLPLFVYRRLPGGGKERATDHEFFRVLHDAPNPEMSSFIWRELVMQNLVTWGNHYSERAVDGLGRPQLWPLRPDRMEVFWDESSRKRYVYTLGDGSKKLMPLDSVFHIPGMGSDGLTGYSLLTMHRRTFGRHDAATTFGETFFRNNARPAVVMKHPRTLSTAAIERLNAQMDELRGSRNSGKTVLLEEGLDLQEIGIPPDDAQYMETRVFEKREIATILRVQAHKLNDLERATFSNIDQQQIEFMQDTMQPWFSRFEGEGNRQLLREDRDHFIGFLIMGYLRGNAKDRAEALNVRRLAGTLNADEWREIEDENPLPDGQGQAYWRPANMVDVIPDSEEEPAVEEPTSPPLLTAVKTALRCPSCDALLARAAGPGTVIECRRCKSEVAV